MKFTVIVALLALASCFNFLQVEPEPEPVLQGEDVLEILKCLLDKSAPLVPEVVSLIEAIKEKDLIKIISIAQKLVEEGKAAYLECFEAEIELAFRFPNIKIDFQCLGGCGQAIMKNVPACLPLVKALKNKDFSAAAAAAADCLPKIPGIFNTCKRCFHK